MKISNPFKPLKDKILTLIHNICEFILSVEICLGGVGGGGVMLNFHFFFTCHIEFFKSLCFNHCLLLRFWWFWEKREGWNWSSYPFNKFDFWQYKLYIIKWYTNLVYIINCFKKESVSNRIHSVVFILIFECI